jgi:DNA invertase Pin-like site-specific DNA recombinase
MAQESRSVALLPSFGGTMTYIAYLRVSTDQQAESGAGLDAQRTAILAETVCRGWQASELRFIEDAASGKSINRPGLALARQLLASGEASVLIVSKLDRLSRSLLDFTTLMQESQRQGWQLIALDTPVDTTTPTGEAMANIMSTFSQLERRLIGERTKAALAEKKAQGIRLGRPPVLSAAVRARITTERQTKTLQAIANTLNDEAVPTAHGGTWRPSTIWGVLAAA